VETSNTQGETRLGIFDSGVGGFSVLREVRNATDADILYFGDCARAPYGNRSEDEIVSFIRDILLRLKQKGVTHFISACNSMSVHTTDKVLKECGIEKEKYLDMIDAVRRTVFPEGASVLIVGTQATIDSGVYQEILRKSDLSFQTSVAKDLAGNIERNDEIGIRKNILEIISSATQASHILYACTHYPLADELFRQEAARQNWKGEFINPAVALTGEVKKWQMRGMRVLTLETSLETDAFKDYSSQAW
jgi:glutamate racemase